MLSVSPGVLVYSEEHSDAEVGLPVAGWDVGLEVVRQCCR